MKLNKKIEIDKLYQIYGELLTEKQKYIFEQYYYEDESIIEIADNLKITKNAVYNSIKKSETLLYEYETKIRVKQNYDENIALLKTNEIDSVIIDQIK